MNALEIISLVQNGLSESNAYPVDFSGEMDDIDCAKTRKAVEDYQNMVINGYGLIKALEAYSSKAVKVSKERERNGLYDDEEGDTMKIMHRGTSSIVIHCDSRDTFDSMYSALSDWKDCYTCTGDYGNKYGATGFSGRYMIPTNCIKEFNKDYKTASKKVK